MIDIHSHILPSIDDGASSLEESIEMAENAYKNGTKAMIATPHCNIPKLFNNYNSSALEDYFDDFRSELKKRGVLIEIYNGMEVYSTDDIFFLLQTEQIITLNNSRYLLIEFKFEEKVRFIEYILSTLLDFGVVPIVAHPERYTSVINKPSIVYHWISIGCLIQVNKGSILGLFGKVIEETALKLLRYQQAHFIASDAHSNRRRSPDLSKAYQLICEKFSEEYAKILFIDNPEKVIKDKEVILPKTRSFNA